MPHPRPLRLGAALLAAALAGCAGDTRPPPPAMPLAEDAASGAAPAIAPGGVWVATDAFPGTTAPALPPKMAGLHLRLDQEEASDLMGRACSHPAYRQSATSEATFLGRPDRRNETPALDRMLTVVEVSCDGMPFGSYARWRDDSLLGFVDGTAVRLVRADSLPSPAATLAAAAGSPASAHGKGKAEKGRKGLATRELMPMGDGAKLVYLASYRTTASARQGWQVLQAKAAGLGRLEPDLREVDLGAKGHFVRLFAKTPDDAVGRQLCRNLRSLLPDCGAANR